MWASSWQSTAVKSDCGASTRHWCNETVPVAGLHRPIEDLSRLEIEMVTELARSGTDHTRSQCRSTFEIRRFVEGVSATGRFMVRTVVVRRILVLCYYEIRCWHACIKRKLLCGHSHRGRVPCHGARNRVLSADTTPPLHKHRERVPRPHHPYRNRLTRCVVNICSTFEVNSRSVASSRGGSTPCTPTRSCSTTRNESCFT